MKDLQEMKRVKLFLAGLCMMVMPCVSGAQEEDTVKGLHLVGRDQGKNVLLRWAAGDYALWMAALQKGFVLERYAFDTSSLYSASAYSDSTPPPVKTLIRIPPFMEMDTSVLASKAEEDPYAALLGEAVFSPGIQFSMGDDGSGNSPWKAISDKLQEKTIRFTLANLAYDRSFPVACMGTMGYRDTSLQPGFYYLYRVFVDSTFEENDTAFYFTRLENRIPVPPLQVLEAEYGDGVVELTWRDGFDAGSFIGYFIERSEGSSPGQGRYVRLNDVPYTVLQDGRTDGISYRDSLPSNDREYVYRLVGLDLFGQETVVAMSYAGQGKDLLRAIPCIDSVYAWDASNLAIAWSFPEEQENRLEKMELYATHAPGQLPDPEHLMEGVISKKERRIFLVGISELESYSSYFYLRAIGKHGESYFSLPFFYRRIDSVPPAPPAGLAYRVDGNGRMQLSWKPSSEKDVAGYRVFLSNSQDGDPVQLTSSVLRDTVFDDTVSLRTAQYFYYRVVAEDKAGNMSDFSEALAVKNQRPRKPAPALFSLQHCRRYPDRVELVWYNGWSPYLKGFRLYHKSDTAEWSMIADFPLPESGHLEDTAAFAFKYPASTLSGMQLFNIVAYGEGKEDTAHSPYFFEAKYLPPVKMPVLDLFADRENRWVQVEWKNPKGKGIKRVYLYRSSETEPLRLLGTLMPQSGLSRQVYVDKSVKMNTYYQYRLQLEFADGSWSEYSKPYGIEY